LIAFDIVESLHLVMQRASGTAAGPVIESMTRAEVIDFRNEYNMRHVVQAMHD
jgi:hypothetical protein